MLSKWSIKRLINFLYDSKQDDDRINQKFIFCSQHLLFDYTNKLSNDIEQAKNRRSKWNKQNSSSQFAKYSMDENLTNKHTISASQKNQQPHSVINWRKVAQKMPDQQNYCFELDLDYLNLKLKEVQSKELQFFINMLNSYNKKIKVCQPTKSQKQIHNFIYAHLNSILKRSPSIQSALLDKLNLWYKQSINPRPAIIDIIKQLQKKKSTKKTNQDKYIRKDFKSNMYISVNNFYRKRLDTNNNEEETKRVIKSLNRRSMKTYEDLTILRKQKRKQYDIKSWKTKTDADKLFKIMISAKQKKQADRYQSFSNHIKPKENDNPTKRHLSRCNSEGKCQQIFGLTLLRNPFESKNEKNNI